jgi:hypothetical protein
MDRRRERFRRLGNPAPRRASSTTAGQSEGVALPADKGEVRPAKFIVLEEPSGRARAGLRALIDFVVLLDLPLEIALARKVVDDVSYYLKEAPQAELAVAMQRLVDYYSQYPAHRAYYQYTAMGCV